MTGPVDSAPSHTSDAATRRVKIAALISLAVAVVALSFAGERLATPEWVASADIERIVWLAALWFAGANAVALGLILLLAGLRDVPLLTSARARGGAWTKLAGANLLILCFAFVGLEDSTVIGKTLSETWVVVPGLILFVIAARSGIVLVRNGWKYEAIPADRLLAEDARSPIVYLRAFQDDEQILLAPAGRFARLLGSAWQFLPPFYMAAISPEQELALFMNRIGPVVAIGKPGERLPELGAARLYVADDRWRDRITELMRQARMVIIRAGDTPNLWWEIDQAMIAVPRQRIVLVCLGNEERLAAFDRTFSQRFGAPQLNEEAPPAAGRSSYLQRLVLSPSASRSMGRVLYFDHDGTPRAESIRFGMTWAGAIMGMCRPHKDPLESALTRALQAIGVEAIARKNQTTAVLLALFGGIIGLHHFYLGNRRKGVRYLVFAPIAFPVILGWIDAVRFLLVDAQQFEKRFLRSG